jgi:putative zinc finger protein
MKRLKSVWRLLNLSCREISHLASESLDRDLDLWERIALKSHLLYCTACRRFLQHIQFIRQALGKLELHLEADSSPSGPVLPQDVRERIERAMKEE